MFGRMEPFSGRAEDFECYVERLEQFMLANGLDKIALAADGANQDAVNVRDGKRRAVFLSANWWTNLQFASKFVVP